MGKGTIWSWVYKVSFEARKPHSLEVSNDSVRHVQPLAWQNDRFLIRQQLLEGEAYVHN